MGGGISIPNFWTSDGTYLHPIDSALELGSNATRVAKGWFTDLDTTNITIGGVSSGDIDMDGHSLILDADADTSITADTDDQIDFEIGGSDVVIMDATGLTVGGSGTSIFNDAVSIASSGDTDTLTLNSDSVTTGEVIEATADGLTTGHLMYLESNSADTSTRNLLYARNDNGLATGTTLFKMQQDSDGKGVHIQSAAEHADGDALFVELVNSGISVWQSAVRGKISSSTASAGNAIYGYHHGTSGYAGKFSNTNGAKGLYVDNNSNAYALEIDSEATIADGIYGDFQVMTDGEALKIIVDSDVMVNGKAIQVLGTADHATQVFAVDASGNTNIGGTGAFGAWGYAGEHIALSDSSSNTNAGLGQYFEISSSIAAGKVMAGEYSRLMCRTAQTNQSTMVGTESQFRLYGVNLADGVHAGLWAVAEQSGTSVLSGGGTFDAISATVETAAGFSAGATEQVTGITIDSSVNASSTINASTNFSGIYIKSNGKDWFNGIKITGVANDILLQNGENISNATDGMVSTDGQLRPGVGTNPGTCDANHDGALFFDTDAGTGTLVICDGGNGDWETVHAVSN